YSPHLAASPDGSTLFVTGNYLGYRTVAYDAATGVQRWTASWQGTDSDTPTGIAVSPSGDTVYVTGYTFNQGGYVTVAYAAATGAQLWVSRYHNVGGDYAYALGVSPDGSRVFVTGASYDASDHSDYATVAYNAATGRQLWVSRYNGLQSDSEDSAGALAVGADGTTVFVTGSSQGLSIDTDYATVAYDAGSGAQLW